MHTHYVHIKIPVITTTEEAEKVGIIIANRVNGELEKVEDINELPF